VARGGFAEYPKLPGAGAAGTAISNLLLLSGVKNLIVCDKVGILYRGMEKIDDAKTDLAERTNPDNIKGSLADALVGADVFVGVSAPGTLTTEMVKTMNKDAIIYKHTAPMQTCSMGYGRQI